MAKKQKRRELDKIRFSIGAKLITIISIIVLVSLGSITALVSWLVHTDLRITAEANNFEMNRRSAMEAQTLLVNMRAASRVLIQTVTALGSQSSSVRQSADFFFGENPQIAAVFFVTPGRQEQLFVNTQFFSSRSMDSGLVALHFYNQREMISRVARGETVLLNAASVFSRPMLSMFYPWENRGVGAVLFNTDELNNNFGFGVNQSYMLNIDGDVLAHADFSIIREGTNIGSMEFVRTILDSPQSSQQELLETNFGVFHSMTRSVEKNFIEIAMEKIGRFFKESSDEHTRQYVAYNKLNSFGAVIITSIEYDKIFEGIAATTRRNIYLTVAVLSISIIFIWFFSKTISIPLHSLAVAAREIEGGKFKIDFKTKNRDEIGVLSSSFNKMCTALNIFGRFTNREIAVKAMRGEIKPGGFAKNGTVFFSDIRDFTEKSENFTKHYGAEASNKIVSWLNDYFTQMIDCVEKTNGVVDKFIGDAVMAHWGTAYTAGTPRIDAFNCVKAALMMRKALYFVNKQRKAGDPANPLIRIGCGINSGLVTAGQIGSDMRMEYTVIGDPVNLASRIEALTKPLGVDILISEDTWNLVGDKFVTEEMPSFKVKGKAKKVRIFAVVNFSGEPKGPQTLNDVRSLLGINAPDMKKIDINADEKKYEELSEDMDYEDA
ncbi:MAG: adenylate/guanylate cyclase domain-containing protein [Treponema sp.]|nr:adenylate/guanylate cyclase domain-containing protein [Treponema sp.]MCL2237279.1 adenylate/guanylate cyclase domain-containing protein [Treponema sp.]